jgi:hypothetical protein
MSFSTFDMLRRVQGPANIPPQTKASRLIAAVSAQFLDQLASKFGRDLLFEGDGETTLEHAALLQAMEEKAGDDPVRKTIYERTRQLLTPLMEYDAMVLTPNERTLEENAVLIAEIEDRIMTTILRFLGFP